LFFIPHIIGVIVDNMQHFTIAALISDKVGKSMRRLEMVV
jgi:hypothetical protein